MRTCQAVISKRPTWLYSSPCLRCLQTLQPFMQHHGTRCVRVDYSLADFDPGTALDVNAENAQPVPAEWPSRFMLDSGYASLLSRQALSSQNRSLDDLHRRTRAFLQHLL